ncbi:MAG: hypothetical protein AMXMBFR75_33170 [Candidatus Hinthialibacteria bacterium]
MLSFPRKRESNTQSVIPGTDRESIGQWVIPNTPAVIPAKAGIQKIIRTPWIPASAGMTNRGVRG